MKYRSSKIKREHSMIKGLYKLLKKISVWPEIISIIPGRIKPSKKIVAIHLTVQYQTEDGVRCLAKSDAVQEIFFVSNKPKELMDKLGKL